jgi:16S rRNA (guanine527-N7)-methyltransferase
VTSADPPSARRDVERRLQQLAERYRLPDVAAEKLSALAHVLVVDPLAPTSVRDPAKTVDDHLADSLVALELDVVRGSIEVADLGSGAGLPGLPLAVALPNARFALAESSARKCAFIARAVNECRIGNARAVNTRAESWTEGIGRFDLVMARALAPFPVVVEYAAPLLRVGGTLVVWRGRRDAPAEAAAARAGEQLGLDPGEVRWVHPYNGAENRHLHLMSKVRETPSGFPRRPGMAAKRPLGLA